MKGIAMPGNAVIDARVEPERLDAAEVDKILLDGKSAIQSVSPQERLGMLAAMRRGAESQMNILRLRYEVASAIGAEPVKNEIRAEAETQIRAIKYIDGEMAKLKDGTAS